MRAAAQALALALLAGCGGVVPIPLPVAVGTFSSDGALDFVPYDCADGRRIAVAYPSTEAAILRAGGLPRALDRAPSASGARYVGRDGGGGGVEWWAKGTTEGTLSPLGPGEDVASSPGVACRAA